ncbi:MAG: hypothetical protein IPI65_16645 [Bacteroidetes bacterium]|nr:hypothetical protein [Bacteroidota bacterium]
MKVGIGCWVWNRKTHRFCIRNEGKSDGNRYFADNILCLTYTDAGTIAMRKRLLDLLGGYIACMLYVSCICNDVIQANLDYFENVSLSPFRSWRTLI